MQKTLRSLWHFVLRWICIQSYPLLIKIGSYLYPRSFTGLVDRLPLGLHAKECYRSARNKIATLRLIEQYASIPAPLWVNDYQATYRALIMTTVPDQTLDIFSRRLSYCEREQLSKDLKKAVLQMCCIPNQNPFLFFDIRGDWLKIAAFCLALVVHSNRSLTSTPFLSIPACASSKG